MEEQTYRMADSDDVQPVATYMEPMIVNYVRFYEDGSCAHILGASIGDPNSEDDKTTYNSVEALAEEWPDWRKDFEFMD